jgi:hypothetical protein
MLEQTRYKGKKLYTRDKEESFPPGNIIILILNLCTPNNIAYIYNIYIYIYIYIYKTKKNDTGARHSSLCLKSLLVKRW